MALMAMMESLVLGVHPNTLLTITTVQYTTATSPRQRSRAGTGGDSPIAGRKTVRVADRVGAQVGIRCQLVIDSFVRYGHSG